MAVTAGNGAVNGVALRPMLSEAERVLASAGVASPRVDAEFIAAHVLGVSRGELALISGIERDQATAIRELVRRRAAREPLQHLVGTAVLGPVEVLVGPGVFIPRPETELLLEWGLAAIERMCSPIVVDLCTGSGALALAVAATRPDAVVHAVEADPRALEWARRNIARHDREVSVHAADVRDPELLSELSGRVDVVLCNPPYVPEGTPVPPEVADWDPPGAVFGGPDGLSVIRGVIASAARLLRIGGWVAIEHDDTHEEAVPALLRQHGGYDEVQDHRDLAGRPRFATARRSSRAD